MFTEAERSLRLSITRYYETALGAPDRTEWLGKDGVIVHICRVFKLPAQKHRKVRRILMQYCATKNKNQLFDGYDLRKWNTGRPVVIEQGSKDEALLADWLEDNLGFRRATEFLNEHRVDEGRLPIGRSAVMNAFNRMSPRIDRIQKTVQGRDI